MKFRFKTTRKHSQRPTTLSLRVAGLLILWYVSRNKVSFQIGKEPVY